MGAGRFKDKVVLLRLASPDQGGGAPEADIYGNPIDQYGNSEGEYQPLKSVWADVRERLGKEKLDAGAVEAPRQATIRIRRLEQRDEDITEADAVRARGRLWNIRSVMQIEKNLVEILCETGVAV